MNWEQLQLTSLNEILEWAEPQPWCTAMAKCVQDAGWHSEGDVWTHTKMVCGQLEELDEWSTLSRHEQTVLIFTALFHDAAKPLTTQIDSETGRVTSPRHAIKGEHLARTVLRDLECELDVREEICRLVRFHGRPAFLTERTEPKNEVIRLSWLVNNRLLFMFAVADTRGRKTDSMSRPEENLHYWKLLAEEHDCYLNPYPFVNQHTRVLFFRKDNPDLQYVSYEKFPCNVTMLCGLPGSGKDTWLAHNRDDDFPVISLDEIRRELKIAPTDNQGTVVQLAGERCRELLRAGTSFAFNATNLLKQTRQRWLGLFLDYGARIELVYLEPPFRRLLAQNKLRENHVPEHVVKKLAAKVEPPTWAEAHEVFLDDLAPEAG